MTVFMSAVHGLWPVPLPHPVTRFPPRRPPQVFHTWRDHRPLHGYLETLWQRSETQLPLDRVYLPLTAADLEDLERRVQVLGFPPTRWAWHPVTTAATRLDDQRFIDSARHWQDRGHALFYLAEVTP